MEEYQQFFLIKIEYEVLRDSHSFHSVLSWSFEEIQKSKMADPRWPPFNNHDAITTSYDVFTSG